MILKQYKFLFVPIPKCAGTSLRKTLQPYSQINSFKVVYGEDYKGIIGKIRGKVSKLEKYFKTILTEPQTHREIVTELTQSDYFVFTLVRNFYARSVSLWKYLQPKMSFVQFVSWLEYNKATKSFYDLAHIKPCSFTLNFYKDMFPYHYVGLVENLNQDIEHICRQLGLSSLDVPQLNQTKHHTYDRYYTEELVKRIEKICDRDFQLFDYKF